MKFDIDYCLRQHYNLRTYCFDHRSKSRSFFLYPIFAKRTVSVNVTISASMKPKLTFFIVLYFYVSVAKIWNNTGAV